MTEEPLLDARKWVSTAAGCIPARGAGDETNRASIGPASRSDARILAQSAG